MSGRSDAEKYRRAAGAQSFDRRAGQRRAEHDQLERDYRAGRVLAQPARITMALDLGGHYGPAVDRACLAEEPAVDLWEAGKASPTWEQLAALATLTDMPVDFFFREPEANPGVAIICWRSGRGKGCQTYRPPVPIPPCDPPVTAPGQLPLPGVDNT